jgi:hypothetical protein
VPTNEKKALLSNDLSAKFVKWREIAADRNQWCAVCGSKMPSATKQTLRKNKWLSFDTALHPQK